MAKSTFDIFNPEVITENLLSLNSAVKQSYSHAKRHLQDGVSFVKDEIRDMYDKAGDCISKVVLPVNNFLKDLTEIEAEFQRELDRELLQAHLATNSGNLVSVDKALSGYLEENY